MQREAILMPYLRAMSTFRDKVRQLAISGGTAAEILALSDQLRDLEMVDLGVALDDQEGKSIFPKHQFSRSLTNDSLTFFYLSFNQRRW